MLSSGQFYSNYYGHTIKDLNVLKKHLASTKKKGTIFLVGDSSLDNKHWLNFNDYAPACNGYETILSPPTSKCDIAYHLNKIISSSDVEELKDMTVINCAIEESTIGERATNLLPQDQFVRENLSNDDIIICSIGGNDIALKPSISTIWNMLNLQYFNSLETIKNNPSACWGSSHFLNMFKNQIRDYLVRLIGPRSPKKIIVCCIYYPDENISGSWADTTLSYLGYNNDPSKLQASINMIFKEAISKIHLHGVEVVPFALYNCLNSKDSKDYIMRVEPSNIGGEKMAKGLFDVIKGSK